MGRARRGFLATSELKSRCFRSPLVRSGITVAFLLDTVDMTLPLASQSFRAMLARADAIASIMTCAGFIPFPAALVA